MDLLLDALSLAAVFKPANSIDGSGSKPKSFAAPTPKA